MDQWTNFFRFCQEVRVGSVSNFVALEAKTFISHRFCLFWAMHHLILGMYHILVQQISFPDLNNYDTDEAWPLILDNFVDWTKRQADVGSA